MVYMNGGYICLSANGYYVCIGAGTTERESGEGRRGVQPPCPHLHLGGCQPHRWPLQQGQDGFREPQVKQLLLLLRAEPARPSLLYCVVLC